MSHVMQGAAMHFRRGTGAVLYHLVYEGRDIGTLTRSGDGRIEYALDGFHTSGAAASAAWHAHAGRLAYEAQFADAAADGEIDGALRFLAARLHQRREREQARELVTCGAGGSLRLCLDDEDIGRLTAVSSPGEEWEPLWSIAVPMGPADTPAVFALAAARQMWEAVRRAGLWRRMAQWVPPRPEPPVPA